MASWGGALRLQAIITGIVCASAVALAAPGQSERVVPSEPDPSASSEVSRKGGPPRGVAYVLAPEWGSIYRTTLRRLRDDLRAALDADGIRHENLRISGGALRFRVLDGAALGAARESLARAAQSSNLTPSGPTPGLFVHAAADGAFTVQLTGFGLASVHDGFIAASKAELNRRLAGSSFDDYLLSDDGGRIRLEIPLLAAPAHAGRQC